MRLLAPSDGSRWHHAHDENDSVNNARIRFSDYGPPVETPVKVTWAERFKQFVNFISPVQLRFERDSAGNKKKRPMLRFVELECWPKNWDGIIKVKYSQTNIWDVACAVMKQRDPKYGKWVVAGADIGEKAYTDREIRYNAKQSNEMKFFFFKYRGGSRIRYGSVTVSHIANALHPTTPTPHHHALTPRPPAR